jgi:glycosyltransferase involved in cell wall biosynthesis
MSDIPVTILMPAYNTEAYIREAIGSVLAQTFRDFELLIVNDGSTDQTESIIRSYPDSRIRLINQSNQGVSAALNTGLKQARGKYIARFDADDICYPERIQVQYDFMSLHPDYVLTGSDATYMDREGEYLFYYSTLGHTNKEINEKIKTYCPFIHSSVMYIREIALELGGYDPGAHTFEDYLLWMKFITRGKVCNFNAPLIHVRLNPESITIDEKLRGNRYRALKKEILFGGKPVTEHQELRLRSILQKQHFQRFKQYSYYILIAKKYLWDNPNPAKGREYLNKAKRLKPFSASVYGLLLLSLLPDKMVRYLHRTMKRQR